MIVSASCENTSWLYLLAQTSCRGGFTAGCVPGGGGNLINTLFAVQASHRDFLGACLGTGIDRSKVGDVILQVCHRTELFHTQRH